MQMIDRLRELEKAATPGPWEPYIAYSGELGTQDEVGIYAGAGTTHSREKENVVLSDYSFQAAESLPDYEFIAALRNTVLRLLDVVEAARAWRDVDYGSPAETDADAGLLDALAALDATP